MINLVLPHDQYRVRAYDVGTGRLSLLLGKDAPDVGNAANVAGHTVALYGKDGRVVLQVDRERFYLDSKTLTLGYRHDNSGKTTFTAIDGNQRFSVTYPAWWSAKDAPRDPEFDRDEDYLGYVYYISNEPKTQQALLKRWNENAPPRQVITAAVAPPDATTVINNLMRDPDTRTRAEAADARFDARAAEILAAAHADAKPVPVRLAAMNAGFLSGTASLIAYLQSRDYQVRPVGEAVWIDSDKVLMRLHWHTKSKQLSIHAPGDLEVPVNKLAAACELADQLNSGDGYGIWRITPLAAEFVIFENHDGTISTQAVESAIAVIKSSMIRCLPQFKATVGG